jgi:predicted glutamine amidotransferase
VLVAGDGGFILKARIGAWFARRLLLEPLLVGMSGPREGGAVEARRPDSGQVESAMTLFACMCNQPQRLAEALTPTRSVLVAQPPIARWGVGYIQGGEVLLVRTPRASSTPVDLFAAVATTPSDCVIGQASPEAAVGGSNTNENTPPFRFRRWMFAQEAPSRDDVWPALTGPGGVIDKLPDYIRRNIRGRTGAEASFHVMLAMLHDLGAIDENNLPLATTKKTLAAALALVANHLGKAGVAGALGNAAVSNGRSLVFARAPGGDVPLYLRRLWVKGERSERDEQFRGVLIVSRAGAHPGEGYEEVPAGSAVLVSRDLRIDISPLDA